MIFSRRLVVSPPLFIVLAIFHLLLINDCSCLSCFQCSNCVNPGLLAPCPEQYNFCVSFHGYRLFERYADKFCADFCPTDGTRVQKFSHFLYLFCFIFPFSFFLSFLLTRTLMAFLAVYRMVAMEKLANFNRHRLVGFFSAFSH